MNKLEARGEEKERFTLSVLLLPHSTADLISLHRFVGLMGQ
jgi:hypothetical protein